MKWSTQLLLSNSWTLLRFYQFLFPLYNLLDILYQHQASRTSLSLSAALLELGPVLWVFAFYDAFFCCFHQFWAIPLHTGAENSQSTDPNITLQHSVNILFCLKLASICAAMPFLLSSAFLDEPFLGLSEKLKGHGRICFCAHTLWSSFHSVWIYQIPTISFSQFASEKLWKFSKWWGTLIR